MRVRGGDGDERTNEHDPEHPVVYSSEGRKKRTPLGAHDEYEFGLSVRAVKINSAYAEMTSGGRLNWFHSAHTVCGQAVHGRSVFIREDPCNTSPFT